MLESQYQRKLIDRLNARFPGCMIFKMDATQGIPDLLILWQDRWALLEVKASPTSKVQPNQEHYVQQFHNMSFSSFIYPENEEEVLNALQQAFEHPRRTRIPQS